MTALSADRNAAAAGDDPLLAPTKCFGGEERTVTRAEDNLTTKAQSLQNHSGF